MQCTGSLHAVAPRQFLTMPLLFLQYLQLILNECPLAIANLYCSMSEARLGMDASQINHPLVVSLMPYPLNHHAMEKESFKA